MIFKAKKGINLLFVGDSNQAIYANLGGVAKTKTELDALYETSFEELYLTGCYRSTQDVIDFYSSLEGGIDRNSPKYRWNVEFSRDELENILNIRKNRKKIYYAAIKNIFSIPEKYTSMKKKEKKN